MRCGQSSPGVATASAICSSGSRQHRHTLAASGSSFLQVVASLSHAIVIGRLDTSMHRANKHHPAAWGHALYLCRDACTTFHTCPTTATPAGTAARTPAPAGSERDSVKAGWGGCGKKCKRTPGAGSCGGSRRACGTYPALLGLGQLRPHICILLLNTLGRQRGASLRLLFLCWRGGRPLLFVGHDQADGKR